MYFNKWNKSTDLVDLRQDQATPHYQEFEIVISQTGRSAPDVLTRLTHFDMLTRLQESGDIGRNEQHRGRKKTVSLQSFSGENHCKQLRGKMKTHTSFFLLFLTSSLSLSLSMFPSLVSLFLPTHHCLAPHLSHFLFCVLSVTSFTPICPHTQAHKHNRCVWVKVDCSAIHCCGQGGEIR